jgi:hypothetical protein
MQHKGDERSESDRPVRNRDEIADIVVACVTEQIPGRHEKERDRQQRDAAAAGGGGGGAAPKEREKARGEGRAVAEGESSPVERCVGRA